MQKNLSQTLQFLPLKTKNSKAYSSNSKASRNFGMPWSFYDVLSREIYLRIGGKIEALRFYFQTSLCLNIVTSVNV